MSYDICATVYSSVAPCQGPPSGDPGRAPECPGFDVRLPYVSVGPRVTQAGAKLLRSPRELSAVKFVLKDSIRGAPDQAVLDDIRRCSDQLGRGTITMEEYKKMGKASPSMVQRRFGSWSAALDAANLKQSRSKIGITDEELFDNLVSVWTAIGRQPSYDDLERASSKYSVGTYEKRFKGWGNALKAFVEWVEARDDKDDLAPTPVANVRRQRTPREPNARLRWRVLERDGNVCCLCGRSPPDGARLHVDHIVPWSAGGETTLENLRILCERCNLGKSNAVL
jgi:hypothetical protein